MSRCFNRGFFIERGTKGPYQCVRTKSNEIATVVFLEMQENLKITTPNVQPINTILPFKNEGTSHTTRNFWIWPKIFGTINNLKTMILITAEYLLSYLEHELNWSSRNVHANSCWKLYTKNLSEERLVEQRTTLSCSKSQSPTCTCAVTEERLCQPSLGQTIVYHLVN